MIISKAAFLNEINIAAQEIANGKWQGNKKSDEFSDKILNIFRKNSGYYIFECKDHLSDESFVSSVGNLIKSMNTLNQTRRLESAIEKISNILNHNSEIIPGSEKDLTTMSTYNNFSGNLEVFSKLKEQNFQNIPEMLAKWIQFGLTPISKFNFSKEELLELAPFLTYLSIDTEKFTNEDIHEIVSKCSKLQDLVITSDSITQLPTSWPPNLASLNLSMCHNLEEINELPEGLKTFKGTSCKMLNRLPKKLPESMEIFNCGGCEHVSELPILNEGLKKIDFSTTKVKKLPKLPSTLTEIDMRECQLCEKLPDELPESLVNINAGFSGIAHLPLKFPPKLTLVVSWCPNLTLPKDLASIPLPPGAKIIR